MLDLDNEHRLRTSVTLRQLFELQDVAVVEGDRQWQMSEFRRTDLAGSPGATRPASALADELAPAQASSRAKLLSRLPGLTPDVLHDVAALARQAGKAGITYEEAEKRSAERSRTRQPIRVGRRARVESGPDDG